MYTFMYRGHFIHAFLQYEEERFQDWTCEVGWRERKIKPDFHSEFKNHSRTAASAETSKTSQNTQ